MWTKSSGLNKVTFPPSHISSLDSTDGRSFAWSSSDIELRGAAIGRNDHRTNSSGNSNNNNINNLPAPVELGPSRRETGSTRLSAASCRPENVTTSAGRAIHDEPAAPLPLTTTTSTATSDATPTTSSSCCQRIAGDLPYYTCCDRHKRELEQTRRKINRLARMLGHWRTNGDALDRWHWAARPAAPAADTTGEFQRTPQDAANLDLECGGGGGSTSVARTNSPTSEGGTTRRQQLHRHHHHHHHLHHGRAASNLTSGAHMAPMIIDQATINHIGTMPLVSSAQHPRHLHHQHHQRQQQSPLGDVVEADLATRRPWQSLVLPVVLACIIFLVALWTRQISLAVTNDTILMIMILMGLFILMSGLALWLSCDQYLETDQAGNDAQGQQQQPHDGEAQLPHCRCQHLRNHGHQRRPHSPGNETGSQNGLNSAAGPPPANSERRCQKCCAVSVIDCQPPDYYSAVMHSMPVHHYLFFDDDGAGGDRDDHRSDHPSKSSVKLRPSDGNDVDEKRSNGDEDDDKQLYLSPPSYEEIQKNRR